MVLQGNAPLMPPRRLVASILVILLVSAIVLSSLLSMCSRRTSPHQQQLTFSIGDAQYLAAPRRKPGGTLAVEVVDARTGDVQITSIHVNPVMRWFLIEDRGTIWFYSSDVGTYILRRQNDAWVQQAATPEDRLSASTYSTLTPTQQDRLRPWRPREP